MPLRGPSRSRGARCRRLSAGGRAHAAPGCWPGSCLLNHRNIAVRASLIRSPELFERLLYVPHRPTDCAAKGLRDLRHRQLVPGKLERSSEEVVWLPEALAAKAPMSSTAIIWSGLSGRID